MALNIFVTGVGGQGTVTLCDLLAERALERGLGISCFHSRGMTHRGGRVSGEVRIAQREAESFGPRICAGGADLMIGLELAELANSFSFLREGGLVIAVNEACIPAAAVLGKEAFPGLQEVRELFSRKTEHLYAAVEPLQPVNLFALGFLAAVIPPGFDPQRLFRPHDLERTIRARLKKNTEENLSIFGKGVDYGKKQRPGSR